MGLWTVHIMYCSQEKSNISTQKTKKKKKPKQTQNVHLESAFNCVWQVNFTTFSYYLHLTSYFQNFLLLLSFVTIDEKMVVVFEDRHHDRDLLEIHGTLLEININDYILDRWLHKGWKVSKHLSRSLILLYLFSFLSAMIFKSVIFLFSLEFGIFITN